MIAYQVCNRLLDAETNEHCEFDGEVETRWRAYTSRRCWDCPACGVTRPFREEVSA